MPITGPTSFSVTPNPYTNTVTLSWSGLSFTGTSVTNAALSFRYGTSSTNGNFGNYSSWHYTLLTSSSGSLTLPGTLTIFAGLPNVTQGHYVQFQVQGTGYNSSGPVVSCVTQRAITNTACVAPTALSVNPTLSEGNVTLSWSGAAAGTGNPIVGYEIQYSDSTDGVNWGGWALLHTEITSTASGAISVSPPATRGSYRRFQIQTRAANASFHSGWRVSSNSIRRNTLPGAPTAFTASPASYITENITLSWSGAAAGTSAIKQYVIQKAESSDNVNWGAWQNVQTITSSATSGSATISPTRVKDVYTLYRICTQDTLDCISAYRNSNSVYSVPLPAAPEIAVPKAGAITYNRNPKVLIQTAAPPGGRTQTVFAMGTDGNPYNSADHPARFSVSGTSTVAVKMVFTNPDTNPGSFTASVHCKTTDAGPAATRAFFVAASPFAERISAGMKVKAAHIAALQTAINVIRDYYGLATWTWTLPITPGRTNTSYWPFHVRGLRAAIQGVVDLLAQYGGVPEISWIEIGTGCPRTDVMNQLQDVIFSL